MDPNANLKEQRQLIESIRSATQFHLSAHRAEVLATYADRLCDLSEALDGWLSQGGFLPDAWRRK